MSPKQMKLLKLVSIALILCGILGQAWTFGVWNLDAKVLPRTPDPSTGRVYRLSLHGILVYQTEQEHSVYWGIDGWSSRIFYFGWVLALIHIWNSGELKRFFRY